MLFSTLLLTDPLPVTAFWISVHAMLTQRKDTIKIPDTKYARVNREHDSPGKQSNTRLPSYLVFDRQTPRSSQRDRTKKSSAKKPKFATCHYLQTRKQETYQALSIKFLVNQKLRQLIPTMKRHIEIWPSCFPTHITKQMSSFTILPHCSLNSTCQLRRSPRLPCMPFMWCAVSPSCI